MVTYRPIFQTVDPNERKIVTFALSTRFAVIVLQYLGNALFKDHDAGVFVYPKSNETSTPMDSIVTKLLGGFVRWDGQYFMHIAKYGYTYENTLAFFPLYPLLARSLATILSQVVIFLNDDSLLLISVIGLNIVFFILAALTLYKLSVLILNKNLAYKSAILFCINPATIFFTAPYTECLFSYLTFKSMLNCLELYQQSQMSHQPLTLGVLYKLFPLSLTTCTRSNGVLNLGFPVYYLSSNLFMYHLTWKNIVKFGVIVSIVASICLLPFILVQIYDYILFCTNFEHNLPEHLVEYAAQFNWILPGKGSQYSQNWCFKTFPLAYSYVQEHYWNVGFLRYFEIKQIPNFLLALPIMFLISYHTVMFFIQHKEYCVRLGFCKMQKFCKQKQEKCQDLYDTKMFVFIVHASFLTLFCFLFVHVQVTTRMICSASPVPFWFAAYYFKNVIEKPGSYSIFLFNHNLCRSAKCAKYYFLSYVVIGTVLFCNFFPWT